jgi:hypothetical protein
MNPETAALSALHDCRGDLLRASLCAAQGRAGLLGARAVHAQKLVDRIDDAIALVGELIVI